VGAADGGAGASAQIGGPQQLLSHTLDSMYLLDVYPYQKKRERAELVVPSEDLYAWDRKCHPSLKECREPDESFASIPALDMSNQERHSNHLKQDDVEYKASHELYRKAPVPPNLFCFKLILEAYLGYKWPKFHSPDPTVPRCALQGGAVVAALTAWRDPEVLRLFEQAQLHHWMHKRRKGGRYVYDGGRHEYEDLETRLLERLHNWFLFRMEREPRWGENREDVPLAPQSPFSTGDADIFLQASPFTRKLIGKLNMNGLDSGLREEVEAFIGGCGYLHDDLQRIADTGLSGLDWANYPENSTMVYALTKNAFNFMLVRNENPHQMKMKILTR